MCRHTELSVCPTLNHAQISTSDACLPILYDSKAAFLVDRSTSQQLQISLWRAISNQIAFGQTFMIISEQ